MGPYTILIYGRFVEKGKEIVFCKTEGFVTFIKCLNKR